MHSCIVALMSQTAPTFITTKEVAEQLGRSKATVKRMAADGRLPYVTKVSGDTGAYLFDPAAVAEFAASEVAQ